MTQAELLQFVVDRLEALGLRYMVVGSTASSQYGEPRFTRDIDIVLELPLTVVDRFCAAFADEDFYLSRSAVEQGVRKAQQFNLIHTVSGEKIDFMPPRGDAWGRKQFERRRKLKLLGAVEAFAGSPEDVILAKLWYFDLGRSDKHLQDIANICRVTPIDAVYIADWAEQLGWGPAWRSVEARLRDEPPSP